MLNSRAPPGTCARHAARTRERISNHASVQYSRSTTTASAVQVRDRADGSKRRGPSGISDSTSKVVLPRADGCFPTLRAGAGARALSGC